METKRCAGPCHLDKPLDEFRRQASSRDGRAAKCKVCTREAESRRRHGWKEPSPDDLHREGFDAGVRAARKHLACLDDDTLKAAAALTHPDRQPPERREEAERVTALLLGARGGLR